MFTKLVIKYSANRKKLTILKISNKAPPRMQILILKVELSLKCKCMNSDCNTLNLTQYQSDNQQKKNHRQASRAAKTGTIP